jgi:hypothetical protein
MAIAQTKQEKNALRITPVGKVWRHQMLVDLRLGNRLRTTDNKSEDK